MNASRPGSALRAGGTRAAPFHAARGPEMACSDNNSATHWQVTRLRIQATRVDQITQVP